VFSNKFNNIIEMSADSYTHLFSNIFGSLRFLFEVIWSKKNFNIYNIKLVFAKTFLMFFSFCKIWKTFIYKLIIINII